MCVCVCVCVNQLRICGKNWSLFTNKNLTLHMPCQHWSSYQKEPGDDAFHIVTLENLDEKIPSQMIITKIIMILRPSFKYFISAWESIQPNERTLTNFISMLTIEENIFKQLDQEILIFLLSMEKSGCESKYLSNIFHISELSFNLFSASAALEENTTIFRWQKVHIREEWKYCCSGKKKR